MQIPGLQRGRHKPNPSMNVGYRNLQQSHPFPGTLSKSQRPHKLKPPLGATNAPISSTPLTQATTCAPKLLHNKPQIATHK